MSRVSPTSAMKISTHAEFRMRERLSPQTFNCPSLSTKNLQSIAHAARYNGINITSLSAANCIQQGISFGLMQYLKAHYMPKTTSGVNKYYKGCVCIFRGKKARTLITVFPLNIPDSLNPNIKGSIF